MSIDYIYDINKDIKKMKLINSNKKKFIEHKNLQKVYLKKNFNEDDLPIDITMGSGFLINKNNIIETYSYIDHGHSEYIQINKISPKWISLVNIINVEKGDPYNIRFIMRNFNKLYNPSDLIYIVSEFIHDGFEIYIKKK